MRNACAHSKFGLSFDAPILADVVKQLFKPLGLVALKEDTADGIREAFIAEMLALLQTLADGSRDKATEWLRDYPL
jgi:hypothetical protein